MDCRIVFLFFTAVYATPRLGGGAVTCTHLFCETGFLILVFAALLQEAREISSDSRVLLLCHFRLLFHQVNEKPVV